VGFEVRASSTALAIALLAGVDAAPIIAADDAAQEPRTQAVASQRESRAAEVVARMAQRIAAAGRLRVRGEIAWDVVQSDGRTLEFGATREVLLRRPDRLRVDLHPRGGGERRLLYDGARVVLHDLDHQVYAAVERRGPIDAVVAYVSDRLGVPVALAEFLSPDLPALLGEEIQSAAYVAEEAIDGVRCDHVALRNEIGGLQLWIAQENSLPSRITISYEHEEGRPQFRAQFADWDLSPRAPDSAFAFEPPKGAEKIVFARRGEAPSGEGAR
jgi:hypothetical protein